MSPEVIGLVIAGLCWTVLGQHLKLRDCRHQIDVQERVIHDLLSGAPVVADASERKAS